MAASGSVEQMPWACLRPRAVEPHCVLAGIPPEDMLSFVRLVAQHPFTPFPDASAIARKIHALRDARVEATVALLEGDRQRLGASGEANDTAANGAVAKRRGRSTPALANGDAAADAEAAAGEQNPANPAKRARRSVRGQNGTRREPTRKVAAKASSTGSAPTQEDHPADTVKIGPDYQADVDPKEPPEDTPRPVFDVEPPLAFSSGPDGRGVGVVDAFLDDMNRSITRRDGFPMSPMNEERALVAYTESNGHLNSASLQNARRLALQRIPRAIEFPGAGPAWTREELCLFARAMAEGKRDFEAMSRNVLPNRPTKELIIHYYTRHKQEWMQFGERKQGLLFDRGIEPPSSTDFDAQFQLNCLHSLAVTAGDGFPPERRTRDFVLAAREACMKAVSYERAKEATKRRQEEAARLLD